LYRQQGDRDKNNSVVRGSPMRDMTYETAFFDDVDCHFNSCGSAVNSVYYNNELKNHEVNFLEDAKKINCSSNSTFQSDVSGFNILVNGKLNKHQNLLFNNSLAQDLSKINTVVSDGLDVNKEDTPLEIISGVDYSEKNGTLFFTSTKRNIYLVEKIKQEKAMICFCNNDPGNFLIFIYRNDSL
jgi:hypothetical protein